MLSGVAENAKQKAEAEKLARAVEGVKKLYNEILVIKAIDKKKGAIEGFVDDTVIESKINALLLDAGGVNVTNFRWRPVGGGGRRASVGAVRDDLLDEGKQAPNHPQHHDSAVTVLNIGRMNLRPQHHAKRIDRDVPLAPLDLLARVISGRIDAEPPFSAPLALWLSMMASVGEASLPASSRTSTNSGWWMRISVPSHSHSWR